MPRPALLRLLCLTLSLGPVLACGSSTDEGSGQGVPAADIVIPLNASTLGAAAFNPHTFTVSFAAQPRVVWGNRDRTSTYNGSTGTTHHLLSDDGVFDSGTLAPGKAFGFTFDSAGTYAYHCTIHPTMVGEVVITP